MNKLVAFLKTPLGILIAIVLAVAVACCCGGTVLGALVGDPEPKNSSSPQPPRVITSVTETAVPSPSATPPAEPVTAPTTEVAPPPPPPKTTKPPAPPKTTGPPKPACHPNYSACLPIVGDLNCGDISQRNFNVIGGRDPYGLDRDNDGIACEQN